MSKLRVDKVVKGNIVWHEHQVEDIGDIDSEYLKLDGSNANQTIDLQDEDLVNVGGLGVGIANPTYPVDIRKTADTDADDTTFFGRITVSSTLEELTNELTAYAAEIGHARQTGTFDGSTGGEVTAMKARYFVNIGGATISMDTVNLFKAQRTISSFQNYTTENFRGFYIENLGDNGTTNNYGVYIEDQTGSTNDYAIYTNAGKVRLGDETTIGDGTNQAKFANDGTLTLEGTATVYDDLRVPVNSVKVGGTRVPADITYKGGAVLAFGDESVEPNEEYVYFTVQIPHKWKEGSAIEPHVHWVTDNATTGNVKWRLTYSWANIDGTFPAETTITATEANAGTDTHNLTSLGAISGTGKTASSMLICSLSRASSDAADTYTDDALLLEIDFHYEVDKLGEASL